MALNRNSTNPMYRLGRIAALAEPYLRTDRIPEPVLDKMLSHPLAGLAMLQKIINNTVKGGHAANLHEGIANPKCFKCC